MAYISPVLGDQLLVKIGDGAATEVFTHPALINTSRGVSFSTNVESDELVDLADQSAPAQTVRRVRSTDCKIDGAGMLHAPDTKEWLDWAQGGEIKNIKVTDGNWVITGPFVLTSFQVTGERLKSSTCQITLEQAGAVTITAAV
ncbi:MAG TPA: phage tail tube protein [Allosphingosinicella sp.]|jgi:predicted secreted protein